MTTRTKRTAKPRQIEALIGSDRVLLKELMKEALQEVLEAEMTEALGAGPGERTADRVGYRSGYYSRGLVTRIGKLELRVPRDREGRFSTELFARYLFSVIYSVTSPTRNAPGSGRLVYRHETVPLAAGRPAPGDRHTGRQPEGRHQAGESRLVERAERPRHGVAHAAEDRPANRRGGHALAPCHRSAALPARAPDELCRQTQDQTPPQPDGRALDERAAQRRHAEPAGVQALGTQPRFVELEARGQLVGDGLVQARGQHAADVSARHGRRARAAISGNVTKRCWRSRESAQVWTRVVASVRSLGSSGSWSTGR